MTMIGQILNKHGHGKLYFWSKGQRGCNRTGKIKKERRVLTVSETELFFSHAENTFYYNLFVVAIETGMRIGELVGLQWSDVDFNKKVVHVKRTLCYFQKAGKYVFEWHEPKTHNSKRIIPLTTRAVEARRRQKVCRQEILLKNAQVAQGEYRDLVFTTRKKILGHSSLQLTMDLYCHVTEDTLFDEMSKMEAAI